MPPTTHDLALTLAGAKAVLADFQAAEAGTLAPHVLGLYDRLIRRRDLIHAYVMAYDGPARELLIDRYLEELVLLDRLAETYQARKKGGA